MKKDDALQNIVLLESKLIKLEISLERINRIKIRINNLNLCHCKSKQNLKHYFNKSLIVYVNHVLLGIFIYISLEYINIIDSTELHSIAHTIKSINIF